MHPMTSVTLSKTYFLLLGPVTIIFITHYFLDGIFQFKTKHFYKTSKQSCVQFTVFAIVKLFTTHFYNVGYLFWFRVLKTLYSLNWFLLWPLYDCRRTKFRNSILSLCPFIKKIVRRMGFPGLIKVKIFCHCWKFQINLFSNVCNRVYPLCLWWKTIRI